MKDYKQNRVLVSIKLVHGYKYRILGKVYEFRKITSHGSNFVGMNKKNVRFFKRNIYACKNRRSNVTQHFILPLYFARNIELCLKS